MPLPPPYALIKGSKSNSAEVRYDLKVAQSSSSSERLERRTRIDTLRDVLTTLHLIRMAKMIDRSIRRLSFSGVKFLRSLARTPIVGRGFDPLLARVDTYDVFHFELEEVLRVCTLFAGSNVPFWVAGGWGLDALVGCQTRRHRDLDLVVHPFHENLPKVGELLTSLGYERTTPLGGTEWFPNAEVYVDKHGHDVQVLDINWELLNAIEKLLGTETQLLLARFTAVGTLDNVVVPALSLVAQQLFHLGYPPRPEESHAEDIVRLISMQQHGSINPMHHLGEYSRGESRQPSTLLLVPIFAFPPDLWRLCRLYHNDLMVPPHVTLAIPFMALETVDDEVVQRLTKLFDATPQFDFELNAVRWFNRDVVYFEPTNAATFRSITERLQHEFPDFDPYGGAFDEVIPHVTLSEHGSLADRRIIGRLAPRFAPISTKASHAWLMSNERSNDEWSLIKVFHLGSPQKLQLRTPEK